MSARRKHRNRRKGLEHHHVSKECIYIPGCCKKKLLAVGFLLMIGSFVKGAAIGFLIGRR